MFSNSHLTLKINYLNQKEIVHAHSIFQKNISQATIVQMKFCGKYLNWIWLILLIGDHLVLDDNPICEYITIKPCNDRWETMFLRSKNISISLTNLRRFFVCLNISDTKCLVWIKKRIFWKKKKKITGRQVIWFWFDAFRMVLNSEHIKGKINSSMAVHIENVVTCHSFVQAQADK